MTAYEKCLNRYTQPQYILLGPICSGRNHLTCQPFQQQPLQQGRKARKHHAVKCAAAASKDAIKQALPQDVSEWPQSMGIESTGLRIAEFAGDAPEAVFTMSVPSRQGSAVASKDKPATAQRLGVLVSCR